MKYSYLSILICCVTFSAVCQVHVKGYFRKNGTFVESHYRSNPDGILSNNWSYPGNVNPYTGKVAPGNSNSTRQNSSNYITYPNGTSSNGKNKYSNDNSSYYKSRYKQNSKMYNVQGRIYSYCTITILSWNFANISNSCVKYSNYPINDDKNYIIGYANTTNFRNYTLQDYEGNKVGLVKIRRSDTIHFMTIKIG
ncbi:MAG: hypothetical protein IPL09_11940 [Bacteroidetes bacterium]|nr:hypothetical protein [Bacteroidota bacterium]